MREQLQKWLQTAKIWYENRSDPHTLPDNDAIDEIADFLRLLSVSLSSAVSVFLVL